ncbi:MAG: UDP-N-acetylmuramoyl-L-alanine--D-glutamate ligase [Lachnospiraceae bacterium]|nr:UDP-N-acetylmuramoyl-L-alanine--D-glutamate ligase [Lachnospiraceae bacterium]
MDLQGKKVLVVGCGKSGIGAAWLLNQYGAVPVLFDSNEQLDVHALRKKNGLSEEICVVLGNVSDELKKELALVVVSPGVPVDTPFMDAFRDANIPIWGEVELAWNFGKGRVIAITGTNGKTTTTTLVGDIMKAYFDSAFVVGNIGTPYTQEAPKMKDDSVTVAEISSFQLETTQNFHPSVSAILNITPDHLNRHHTMENYAAVKESITKNQTKSDFCVLNYEDQWLKEFGKSCPAEVIWFSSARKLQKGYYLDGDIICRNMGEGQEELMHVGDMNLIGVHNYENVMAAIAMSAAFGVPMQTILSVVKSFKAVEHRIEYVATKRGVVYYNDSKGTNPDAAIQAIKAMKWPTVLIGGGYDKGNTYDEWIEAFDGKVKLFVLIGQTREAIAQCARAHGITNIVFADTFEEAMDVCVENAKPGDAVLLSPACASWGMFPNYEVRGEMFKEYVNRLEE